MRISNACDLSVLAPTRPFSVAGALARPAMKDKGEIGAPMPRRGQAPTVRIRRSFRAEMFAKSRKNQGGIQSTAATMPMPEEVRTAKLKERSIALATKTGKFEELPDNILLAFFQKHLNCSGQT